MKKNTTPYRFLFSVLFAFILSGCARETDQGSQFEVAVTNSYLQCAVKDLSGDDMEVFSLAPPGMCPGHFDITPAQAQQLRNCKLLILFDFQSRVESSLSGLKSKGLKTALIKTQPGLCIPDTYLDACRQLCDILSSEFPENRADYGQRLTEIESRTSMLGEELIARVSDTQLTKAKVLASGHQSEFINWLGMETIATFAGTDAETASNINDCLNKAEDQGVRFVIANRQEGTALAVALAERLNIQTIVFSNFPDSETSGLGFDALLRRNIQILTEAAQ